MKSLNVSEVGSRLKELMSASEPMELTDGQTSEPAWIMVPIMDKTHGHLFSTGGFTIIVQPEINSSFAPSASDAISPLPEDSNRLLKAPAFGVGKGLLTVRSEDADHLSDFQEYMQ